MVAQGASVAGLAQHQLREASGAILDLAWGLGNALAKLVDLQSAIDHRRVGVQSQASGRVDGKELLEAFHARQLGGHEYWCCALVRHVAGGALLVLGELHTHGTAIKPPPLRLKWEHTFVEAPIVQEQPFPLAGPIMEKSLAQGNGKYTRRRGE